MDFLRRELAAISSQHSQCGVVIAGLRQRASLAAASEACAHPPAHLSPAADPGHQHEQEALASIGRKVGACKTRPDAPTSARGPLEGGGDVDGQAEAEAGRSQAASLQLVAVQKWRRSMRELSAKRATEKRQRQSWTSLVLKEGDLDSLFGLGSLRHSLAPRAPHHVQMASAVHEGHSPPPLARSLPGMLSNRRRQVTRGVDKSLSGSRSVAGEEPVAAQTGAPGVSTSFSACRVPSASSATSLESTTTTCWVDSAR